MTVLLAVKRLALPIIILHINLAVFAGGMVIQRHEMNTRANDTLSVDRRSL
ncbi:MAG: hypothetical protein ABL883_14475 [Terricaulis sp.]